MTERRDWEQLIVSHQATVFRVLSKMVGDPDKIEDLAQEVFLRMVRNLSHFRGQATLTTWPYRIIYTVVVDDYRKSQAQPRMISLDDNESPFARKAASISDTTLQKLEQQRLVESIDKALGELPPQFRMVLILFYREERRYSEIAEIMHVPIGTVKTCLHRGRDALRGILLESSGQEPASQGRKLGALL